MATSPLHLVSSKPDERILNDIRSQINWQSDIGLNQVRIEVCCGVVQLHGSVQTCMEKVEAANAARAVFGVSEVFNHLDIVPLRPRSDGEIAGYILAALRNSTSILEEMPTTKVVRGLTILRGHCRWEFQKQCAERTALSIVGVKRVINLIVVDSYPSSSTPNTPSPALVQRAS